MNQLTSSELMAKAEELMAQAKELRKQEVATIVREVVLKLNEYDIALSDLKAAGYRYSDGSERKSATAGGKKDGRQEVKKKYVDPANPQKMWSGRGRRPKFVVDHEAAGGSLEDLLIKK
jgi:DNA-binding protein H-NS